MNKLLRLSETHYIVIDASIDFTEKDWYYDNMQKSIRIGSNNHITGGYKQKITHSTQPLELVDWENHLNKSKRPAFDKIKPLSLSEVEELVNGYNVEKMTLKKYGDDNYPRIIENKKGFKDGFNAHKELEETDIKLYDNENFVWQTHDYKNRTKASIQNPDFLEQVQVKYAKSIKHCKFFRYKEKAEEYILFNKPCLSIEDLKTINHANDDVLAITIDKLKELVKSKL